MKERQMLNKITNDEALFGMCRFRRYCSVYSASFYKIVYTSKVDPEHCWRNMKFYLSLPDIAPIRLRWVNLQINDAK